MKLELELEQETGGRWLAEFTRFPGALACGPSKAEAIRNAAKVLIESEPAREFKPYMEDREYYDHPDLLATIERIANHGSVDDYTVAGIRAELRDALHNFKREQASPMPDRCPNPHCGSLDRKKRNFVNPRDRCPHPWHSSASTPKGTK